MLRRMVVLNTLLIGGFSDSIIILRLIIIGIKSATDSRNYYRPLRVRYLVIGYISGLPSGLVILAKLIPSLYLPIIINILNKLGPDTKIYTIIYKKKRLQMETEYVTQISLVDEDSSFDTLQEIEMNASPESRRQRQHRRIPLKAKVILQPGNSSEFLSFKVQGITGDISNTGCRAMFPVPIQVGDIYRMRFENQQLDIPVSFVRCLRCRLTKEDAFEAGFAFFRPINLPQTILDEENNAR